MNANDQIVVVTAVVVAAAAVTLFWSGRRAAGGAWFLRRLLAGAGLLVALTAVSSWWLHGVAAADVAACEAAGNSYDCEDAYLVVVMALLAGGLAVVLFVAGLTGLRLVSGLRARKAVA